MFLCAQKHCTLIACHLKHCTLNIVLGRGGRWVEWSSVVWDELKELSCVKWVASKRTPAVPIAAIARRSSSRSNTCCCLQKVKLSRLPHESNSSSSQCRACYTKAAPPNATQKQLLSELSCVRWVVWVVRWEELCEMSCVSCEMSCVKELGWSSVRGHESSSTKCHTKAALEWVELCEMSCVRWVVWVELWEMSCVRWVVWVVRWEELCEMSCVKELGWSSVRGHESSSTKCHTKAALEWVELCEMSWVRWVVWVELWEMSCARWVVWVVRWGVVWDELCALCETTWVKLSERRSNAGGEGGA